MGKMETESRLDQKRVPMKEVPKPAAVPLENPRVKGSRWRITQSHGEAEGAAMVAGNVTVLQ